MTHEIRSGQLWSTLGDAFFMVLDRVSPPKVGSPHGRWNTRYFDGDERIYVWNPSYDIVDDSVELMSDA